MVAEAKKNNHLENSINPVLLRAFLPTIKTPAIATEQPIASKFPKKRPSCATSLGEMRMKTLPAKAIIKPKNDIKDGRKFSQKYK